MILTPILRRPSFELLYEIQPEPWNHFKWKFIDKNGKQKYQYIEILVAGVGGVRVLNISTD